MAEEEQCQEAGTGEPAGGDAQNLWAWARDVARLNNRSRRVVPRVDDVDTNSDVNHEQFLDLFSTSTTRYDELSVVSFGLQEDICRRLLKEGAPLLFIAVLLSTISFCSMTFYFTLVLRVDSKEDELPVGYSSWADCPQNATALPMTAFGHELSLTETRMRVSIPKVFDVAAMCTLIALTAAPGDIRLRTFVGLAVFMLALASSPIYLFADRLGIRVMPSFVDPLITFPMLMVLALSLSSTTIRERSSSSGAVARCPKVLFSLAMVMIFGLNTVLVNVVSFFDERHMHPIFVVGVAVTLTRGCGIIARQVFKNTSLPVLASLGICFAYDTSMAVTLRRYMLAFQDLRNAIIAAVGNAVLEFAINCASSVYAVYPYNKLVREGSYTAASVHINTFFVATLSQLLAEHVALHGCLAYSLFLDPRILHINVQFNNSLALANWGCSFLAEIVVDAASIGGMIVVLPTTFSGLLHKSARSWTAVLLFMCCLHAHLIGLHIYIDPAYYFCEQQS